MKYMIMRGCEYVFECSVVLMRGGGCGGKGRTARRFVLKSCGFVSVYQAMYRNQLICAKKSEQPKTIQATKLNNKQHARPQTISKQCMYINASEANRLRHQNTSKKGAWVSWKAIPYCC